MPASISWLLEIFKDSTGHWNWPWIGAAVVAAGGGIATAIGGIWAVTKFFVERKKANDNEGRDTNITLSGQGAASGRDTTFQGPVTFAPSPELGAQIQKPLAEELAAQRTQIENLTKMLLEKNPAAVGPGAQEAVGEAVQSITQGAAEGDSRLQQALTLLEANKIAEAEPLLKAFAEDKTVRAEQDRKEAAIAYRNLGAIAGLRDPKRALEAYEKAVELDPDDLESLLWTGWIQINYGDLNKAQTRLERVLTLAKADSQANYKYWAFVFCGDIKKRRGDLLRAIESYRHGLYIAEQVVKSDPGNARWQRDLSVSYERVSEVQRALGDLADALKSCKYSFAIRELVAKSNPGNPQWQRDLAASHGMVGIVQEALRNLPGALKSYKDGLAVFDRIAKFDPSSAGWQRDRSVFYEKIGGVQEAQGYLADALESYQESFAIRERLAKSDTGNAGWQRDLSVSYERIGSVKEAQGDLADALKSYRESFAIRERLAKSDPDNVDWQCDLIISYKKIADCVPSERSTYLSRALDIARKLDTSGRLAPADKWMLDDLARLIAELSEQ